MAIIITESRIEPIEEVVYDNLQNNVAVSSGGGSTDLSGYAKLSGATFTGNITMIGSNVVTENHRDIKKTFQSLSISAGSATVNMSNGYNWDGATDADLSLSFSNLQDGDSGTVIIHNTSTSASITITFPSSAEFHPAGGNTYSLGVNHYGVFGFVYDGTTMWMTAADYNLPT